MSKHLGNILQPIPLMDAARRRRGALVHGRGRVAVAAAPGRAQRAAGDRPQDAADLLEHRVVPHALRRRQRLVAAGAGRARRWPTGRCSTAGCSPRRTGWSSDVDRGLRGLRHPAGRAAARRLRRRPVQLVRPPLPPPLLGRRPGGAGDPARVPATSSPCCWRRSCRSSPSGSGRTSSARSSPDAPDSVHLAAWPTVDGALIDDALAGQVALVRRLVELGRAARGRARRCATASRWAARWSGRPGWAELPDELRRRSPTSSTCTASTSSAGELVDRTAKANFRALGKRFGKRTPTVAAAIAAADAGELAAALRASGRATVAGRRRGRRGRPPTRCSSPRRPREGWAVATDGGETVALDLELTPELRRAGLAREVVRLVQEARKSSGLEVTDRIELRWQASGELAEALREHGDAGRRGGAGHQLRRRPRNRARAHRRGPRPGLHRHPFGSVIR